MKPLGHQPCLKYLNGSVLIVLSLGNQLVYGEWNKVQVLFLIKALISSLMSFSNIEIGVPLLVSLVPTLPLHPCLSVWQQQKSHNLGLKIPLFYLVCIWCEGPSIVSLFSSISNGLSLLMQMLGHFLSRFLFQTHFGDEQLQGTVLPQGNLEQLKVWLMEREWEDHLLLQE